VDSAATRNMSDGVIPCALSHSSLGKDLRGSLPRHFTLLGEPKPTDGTDAAYACDPVLPRQRWRILSACRADDRLG
jgi:hypothetical protein